MTKTEGDMSGRTWNVTRLANAGLIVILALLVILLAAQNHGLRKELEEFTKPPESMGEGEAAPLARVRTLGGDSVAIDFRNRKHAAVLCVFSTTCPLCQQSVGAWKQIAERAANHGVEFLAISLKGAEATRSFVEANNLKFPVYVASDSTFKVQFKVHAVPQTMLIDSTGLVAKNWVGAIDSVRQLEVEGLVFHQRM